MSQSTPTKHDVRTRCALRSSGASYIRTCPALIPGLGKMSYEDRLEHFRLWSLEERRNRSDPLEVFRMFKGLSLTPFNYFFTLNTSANMQGHSAKIVNNRRWLDLRLHQWSIDSTTVNSFKNGLEHIKKTRMGYFKDWWSA